MIFLSTWKYNSLGDLTRQHKVWRKILLNTLSWYLTCFFQRIWPLKLNEITWRILLWIYQEQFVNFPGKQGFAINLPWTALKSKQHIELFDTSCQLLEGGGGIIYFLFGRGGGATYTYKLWKLFPSKHQPSGIFKKKKLLDPSTVEGAGGAIIK